MTAAQIIEETEKDLSNKFDSLHKEYPNIYGLKEKSKDYSDKKKQLLLEILSKSDDKFLNLIDEQADPFLALLDSYGDKDGMLWEELVIRFEWTFEI